MQTWFDAQLDQKILDGIQLTHYLPNTQIDRHCNATKINTRPDLEVNFCRYSRFMGPKKVRYRLDSMAKIFRKYPFSQICFEIAR